jgi:hypothetical protein
MYCPECGTRIFHIFPKKKWERTCSAAWLRIADESKAFYDGPKAATDHDMKQIIAAYHTQGDRE